MLVFTLLLIVITVAIKLLFANNFAFSGFSPIIAIALFSGMIIKDKGQSFLLPLIALFLSDVVIEVLYRMQWFAFAGLYKYQFFNYALLLLSTAIGWALKGRNVVSVFAGAVAAPTAFFFLSNFSVWYTAAPETFYSQDFKGLMQCLEAGLPFYRNALVATVIFLPVLIIAYNFIVKKEQQVNMVLG